MTELTDAQHDAFKALVDPARARCLLVGEVGAGKTVVTSDALAHVGGSTIIVTPSYAGSGPRHWVEELARAEIDTVSVATGSAAKRLTARMAFCDDVENWSGPHALIVTYDGLRTDLEALCGLPFDNLVIDESHRLAGRTTHQAKAAKKLANHARRLWCLDGTPVMNEAADLWPIFHMIDPKTYRSFWRWAHQHLIVEVKQYKGTRFPTKLIHGVQPGQEVEIKKQLDEHAISFAADHQHEEPRVTVLPVDLSPAERRLYTSLEKHHYAEVNGNELVAKNEVSKMTLLRRIASDWSEMVDEVEPGSKVKAVAELVNGKLRGEKVLVLAAFQATCGRLVLELGPQAVLHHGGVKDAARKAALDMFADDPETRVLVGTLASLGEGIDGLQHVCNNLVLIDREWNHPRNDQCVGRLYRHGQEHRVNVWHVVAADSTDQKVAETLARKGEIVEALDL